MTLFDQISAGIMAKTKSFGLQTVRFGKHSKFEFQMFGRNDRILLMLPPNEFTSFNGA